MNKQQRHKKYIHALSLYIQNNHGVGLCKSLLDAGFDRVYSSPGRCAPEFNWFRPIGVGLNDYFCPVSETDIRETILEFCIEITKS